MSACKSCGEEIVFARTVPSGVAMPVNVQWAIGGTVELTEDPPGRWNARVIPLGEAQRRTDLHEAHFATCPDGEQWRRKRTRPSRRQS
jgi:hypothetical protein